MDIWVVTFFFVDVVVGFDAIDVVKSIMLVQLVFILNLYILCIKIFVDLSVLEL